MQSNLFLDSPTRAGILISLSLPLFFGPLFAWGQSSDLKDGVNESVMTYVRGQEIDSMLSKYVRP